MSGRRKRRRAGRREGSRRKINLLVSHMIFCQRCKKANPSDAEYCEECGAVLMLISRARGSYAFDVGDNTRVAHMLARISALESTHARAKQRSEQLQDLAPP